MLKALIPIDDINKRIEIFFTLTKDSNFISASILILVLSSVTVFTSTSVNLLYALVPIVIMLLILALVITYDTGISYLIFKINTFNAKNASLSLTTNLIWSFLFGLSEADGKDGSNKLIIETAKSNLKNSIRFLTDGKLLKYFIPIESIRKQFKLPIVSWPLKLFKNSFSLFKQMIVTIILTAVPQQLSYQNFTHKYFSLLFFLFITVPLKLVTILIKKIIGAIVYFITNLHLMIFQMLKDIAWSLIGLAIMLLFSLLSPIIFVYQFIMNVKAIIMFIIRIPKLLYNFVRNIVLVIVWCISTTIKILNLTWMKLREYLYILKNQKEYPVGILKITVIFLLFIGTLLLDSLNIFDSTSSINGGSPTIVYLWLIMYSLLFFSIAPEIEKIVPQLTMSIIFVIMFLISIILFGTLTFILIPFIFFLSLTSSPANKVIYLISIAMIVAVLPSEFKIVTEYILLSILLFTDYEGEQEFHNTFRVALCGDYKAISTNLKDGNSQSTA